MNVCEEWNEELGARLEKETGIPSALFKLEFDNPLKAYSKCYFLYDKRGVLPICEIKDKYSENIIPILALNATILEMDYFFKLPKEFYKDAGIRIEEKGRYDLVVPLQSSFREHCKSLERISRCFNKCQREFNFSIYKGIAHYPDNFSHLIEVYSEYWIKKGDFPLIEDNFKYCQDFIASKNEYYTIEVMDKDRCLAVAYFQVSNGELYWHETIRDTDETYSKFAVGNYILLLALKHLCYPNNWNLNLGVSWYDYKKHWHPIEVPVKEIRYV